MDCTIVGQSRQFHLWDNADEATLPKLEQGGRATFSKLLLKNLVNGLIIRATESQKSDGLMLAVHNNKPVYGPDEELRNIVVGRAITVLRISKNFFHESLAISSQIDGSRLINLERGLCAITTGEVVLLADSFEVSPAQFIAIVEKLATSWRASKSHK